VTPDDIVRALALPDGARVDRQRAIKVCAKRPGWFAVPTPLGT
jgi:hypothetical protein